MILLSSITDEIKINPITLSFPGNLEESFRNEYFTKSLKHIRMACLMAIFFYGVFGILDSWLVPVVKYQLWFIRYGVFIPFTLAIFLFTFSRHFKKYMQLSIAAVVVVAGFGIIAMILVMPFAAIHSYYVGLILVFVFGYTFLKLRFIWATLTGWLLVIAYEIAAIWLIQFPLIVLINHNFFFLSSNILGMFVCYFIEFSLRNEFVQAQLLVIEKKKVDTLNHRLEKRVKDRTEQLVNANEDLKQEIIQRNGAQEELKQEIIQRIRAQEELKVSEERYRNIVETIEEGYFETDLNGSFTFFNDSLCTIAGYTREELRGMNNRDYTSQQTSKGLYKIFNKVYQTGISAKILDFDIFKKNGDNAVVEISTSLIRNSSGKVIGFRGVARDVTERKQAEEEKRSLEVRLHRAEKMEALGQLAGGVAHDLNNILGALSGHSELLLRKISKRHGARVNAEKILQSTEKGAAIIQDLLTLARRGVIVSDVINLSSVVSNYLKSPMFEKLKDHHSQVTFRTECDKNLLNIKGSPVHLEKTLMNLVSNAAEAVSEKGEVTIRTDNCYLDKSLRGHEEVKQGDYVVLTISDTGMGIPVKDREKIYEPFYTKKTMGISGTGLGLAIVWGTVKDHKGYIDLQTEVGEGTTFTLYFPATREKPIAQTQKVPIEQYMGNGELVLVVDDVAEQRDVASELLTQLGYEVHLVSSGEEALEFLRENKSDILVLDMIMAPGIDGLETYERVLEVNPTQKAILVSGFSETDRVRGAQKLGAGAYVKKPYLIENIGMAIRDELLKVTTSNA